MTTSSNQRRYWDSCNWISLIAEDEVERANMCQRILEDADAGNTVVITSAFTLAEVIKKKGKPLLPESDEHTIVKFFEQPYVLIHDVTRRVAEQARHLSRRYGLRPSDAIHLATALVGNADYFETWNMNDFGRIPLGELAINIRRPEWVGNLRLPGI